MRVQGVSVIQQTDGRKHKKRYRMGSGSRLRSEPGSYMNYQFRCIDWEVGQLPNVGFGDTGQREPIMIEEYTRMSATVLAGIRRTTAEWRGLTIKQQQEATYLIAEAVQF
jgi:hypothetical protein